ncbi:MAG: L-histidine N(alpha)-methyltransferase [Gluconacetobacter diazotrophicus]|nr:L-histidine N(alpha)-methyltransferase [Gluconacetobacter diazotrophicus]
MSGTGVGEAADPLVLDEILSGLLADQKTLPAKLFYDAEGCDLFGRITTLPEYYVTRAEMALLDRHAGEIAATAPAGAALVEYGASDEAKGMTLLRAGRFAAYVPIDIAPDALAALAGRMGAGAPGLPVHTVAADFLQPLALPAAVDGLPRFGFFPGSTIGNFRPPTAVRFLRMVRDTLGGAEARFVVGTDLRKDPAVLIPAYDDAQGVTAAFNRNILLHVNRLAKADFVPERFRHRAIWNHRDGRIEMHLEAAEAHEVSVAGRTVQFRRGETIHTEDSYKHTREGFISLAGEAGWRSGGFWSDPNGLFGMHLLLG